MTTRARPALRASRQGLRIAGALAGSVGLVAALLFGGAQAASAHDSLVAASPAAGETVSSLSEVTLTFSDNLLALGAGNIVIVTGPDGRHYETDCTALSGPVLTTPVALGAAGEYEVTWRAVSSDGHPVSDTYAFAYAPAPGTPEAEGTAESACANAPAGEAPTTDAAAPPVSDGGGLALGLGIGGGAVVLVGIVVAIILSTRGRTGDIGPEDDPSQE